MTDLIVLLLHTFASVFRSRSVLIAGPISTRRAFE